MSHSDNTASNNVRIQPLAQATSYLAQAQSSKQPLLLLDCAQLRTQYQRIQAALPEVTLFYAVKSFPHPAAIQTLRELGAGFDIASSGEADLMRAQQINPRHCIHTHPIKNDAEIRAALRLGCTTFVVDNLAELEKLKAYRNRIGLLLRLSFRHSQAKVDLSKKFGCSQEDISPIIERAQVLGLHIKGLSFHVGSQCVDSSKHVEAIQACAKSMRHIKASHQLTMHILDIGGGFPVNYADPTQDNIDEFCSPIRSALAALDPNLQIIAEPGRYLAAPSVRAISTIIGKAKRGQHIWYYLNDGIYGSYSGQLFDHACYPLRVFSDQKVTHSSVLSGPTCDSIDLIAENIQLPELEIGDIIVADMMGAYTWATATRFNLLPEIEVRVFDSPAYE